MGIQYSGSTLVNATFVPATRGDLVNNITSNLLTAGWTAISGTPGSSADVTMESAATPSGAKVRFRFFDPGANNSAQVTMKHSSGSPTSQIAYLNPINTWRIIANKYQFFAFMTGGGNATTARGSVMGGVLWTPTFISVASGDAVSWMQATGQSDADSSAKSGFRRRLRPTATADAIWSTIFGSTLVEATTGSAGNLSLLTNQAGVISFADNGYRWEDGSLQLYEALVSWATGSSSSNEGRIKGMLWDAMIVSASWASEATISFDNKTWLAITDTASTSSSQLATLFVVIP